MENKIPFITAFYAEATDKPDQYTLTIFQTTEDGISQKITIPKINLSLSISAENKRKVSYDGLIYNILNEVHLDFGSGAMSSDDGMYFQIEDITEYHKMTLRDIEKELGYKIKLQPENK